MALVVLRNHLTKENLKRARRDYQFYIKITVDISQKIVIIGGEYHTDAEKLLLERYGSLQEDIWGGGYNLKTKKFETNAIINLRPGINESMEIINPKLRQSFLNLVTRKMKNIEELI